MNNEQNEKMELNLDDLEQVAGGGNIMDDLINKVKRDGRVAYYRDLVNTQGKAVASNDCCAKYPEYCSVCKAVVALCWGKCI